mmetsp:Transcript_16596/g.28734  ORF Transcript_16596/g.28734 Transcript_16596/m.28734 type:complete len:810 (+) Transcript_16596:647-3076(+)
MKNVVLWSCVVVLGLSTIYFAFGYMKYMDESFVVSSSRRRSKIPFPIRRVRRHASEVSSQVSTDTYGLNELMNPYKLHQHRDLARRNALRENVSSLDVSAEILSPDDNITEEEKTKLQVYMRTYVDIENAVEWSKTERVFVDKVSNATMHRPGLPAMNIFDFGNQDYPGPGRERFTSMVVTSERYKPELVNKEQLEEADFPAMLLLYQVRAKSVPVYRSIATMVDLYDTPENSTQIVRKYKHGEYIMGLETKLGRHSSWLRVGQSEYVPIYSRLAGKKGMSVYLKLMSNSASVRAINERTFGTLKDCAILTEFQNLCKRNNEVSVEMIRILSDFPELVRIRNTTADIPPPDPALSFREKLQLLYIPLTEKALCHLQRYWVECTSVEFCSWVYAPTGRHQCKHDELTPAQIAPVKSSRFNASPENPKYVAFPNQVDPSKKYFVYQPSGGFNNQRIQLEEALVICMTLNRTCVLPHAAQHTNFYMRYNLLAAAKTTSMQRVFDFEALNQIVDVLSIPSNMTLRSWVDALGGTQYVGDTMYPIKVPLADGVDWRVVMRNSKTFNSQYRWTEGTVKLFFKAEKAKFLYFANHTMWGALDFNIFAEEMRLVKRNLRYTDDIKRVAIYLANNMGDYNALHVRRGDKKREANFQIVARNAESYAKAMMKYQKSTKTLYIASDESDANYFTPLSDAGFNIVRWQTVDSEGILKTFLQQYPAVMFMGMLGIIEQLLCAYAYRFLGSSYSTFTTMILRLRRSMPFLGGISRDEVIIFEDAKAKVNGTFEFPKRLQPLIDGDSYKSRCNPYQVELHTSPC